MRLILSILLLFLLSLQGYSKTIVALPENELAISNVEGFSVFKNSETFGLPGEPNLPVTHLKILVPPEADLKTVKVNIENEEIAEINGRYSIKAATLPVTTSGIKLKVENREIIDGKDVAIYSTNSFFPASFIRSVKIGKLRSYKIVDVTIQRCQYNPVSGKLIYLKSGNVNIDYNSNNNRIPDKFSIIRSSTDIIKSTVCNYNDIYQQYGNLKKRAVGDYVIITTASFKSSSTKLDKFAAIKSNDGLNVKIITESDWGGGSGATAVNNIRNWLINNEPEFVFIIGDPNKSSKIPMVDGPHASSDAPLTDFCYADLNGTFFTEGKTRYYEYENEGISKNRFDQYPEIHVGRLPVYGGNMSDAEMLLQRMIDYMTEPASIAESYRFSAILPLNTFNDSQNGICFGEELRKRVLDPKGVTYERIYYNHAGTTANFPCSYDSTVSIWNRGKFGIMCLQGHGLSYMAEKAIDNLHVAELTSDGYVHGFNISCHNGCPYEPSNLGFSIMKKVGISQIASAVEIWYSTSSISNYGTGATGNDYAFSYIDNLVNYKKGAGECFSKARSTQILETVNDWQNHVELNLYGCPAIGLYTYGINDKVDVIDYMNNRMNNSLKYTCSSGKIIFHNYAKFNGKNTIEIYDSKGKCIKRLRNLKGENFVWDYKKSGLSKGVYFVKYKENLKELSATKLIVNN